MTTAFISHSDCLLHDMGAHHPKCPARLRAVECYWLPALETFKPEMLLASAGFDAHRDDDLALLNLVKADYAWVTEKIKTVAERHAAGRIVSVLEGASVTIVTPRPAFRPVR